jgi:hypothetical protein
MIKGEVGSWHLPVFSLDFEEDLVGVGVVIFCFPPCSFFFFLEFTFGLSSM